MPMKLTIMVTTMPSRSSMLDNLVNLLGMADHFAYTSLRALGSVTAWVDHERGVEVLAYSTPPFDEVNKDLTFGAKRNLLVSIARGEFVCCFDDDDEPHPRFLELVLAAIEKKPDVIGYKVACYGYAKGPDGEFDPSIMEPADVSTKYDGWYNDRNGFKYVRCPHHIVPVRREIVQAIGFKPMHHGEDHEYSRRLRDSGLLKKEAYIDEFMYAYLFNAKKAKGE